jgi:hypothetical protein
VNNCQLVDGKDVATILTDSGRQFRDFVDSYAASLTICDLERGSFAIPKEGAKFREPSLSQIAVRHEPQLHVSPGEIGLCLSCPGGIRRGVEYLGELPSKGVALLRSGKGR